MTSRKVIDAIRIPTIQLNIFRGILYSDELNSLHLQMYADENETLFV
jgi:hypothetical protein